jgi:hypothetical protein
MNLELIKNYLLDKMSNETENAIGPNTEQDDQCALQICECIFNGNGKLKIEDVSSWFSFVSSRVVASENLISCIPLELMASWNDGVVFYEARRL